MIQRKIAIPILFIGVIISLILLAGNNQVSKQEGDQQEPRKTVEVITISPQDSFKTSIRAKGVVKPKNYTIIRSETPGVVQYLAPVGKSVSKGETLFSLSDSNIQNTYLSALQSLTVAQQSLEQTRVLNHEIENQGKLSVASAEEAMNLAQSNLQIAEREAQQLIQGSQENAQVTYESAYTLMDQILRFLGKGSLDEYAFGNFPTLQTQARSNAEHAFVRAKERFDVLPPSPEITILTNRLVSMSELISDTKRVLDSTFTVLSFGVAEVIGNSLPQSLIDSYEAQVVAYQNQSNVQNAAIKGVTNATRDAVLAAEARVTQARSGAELARIQYENAKSSFDSSIRSARLRELGAQSQLSGAQIQFSAASSQFQNLSLKSPFEGVVISQRVNLFDQVTPGREIIELGSAAGVEIEISLDEREGRYVRTEQQVKVNNEVMAKISEVSPQASLESGKVMVTIQADNTGGKITVGAVAEVVIDVDFPQQEGFRVPLSSVTIAQEETFVLVVENERVQKRLVTLGDIIGSAVFVRSGLQVGDTLIVKDGALVKVGERVIMK